MAQKNLGAHHQSVNQDNFENDLSRDPITLDRSFLAVLRIIGGRQLRPREIYLESRGSSLSWLDVDHALGNLLDRCLIERASNGFDCLYVLTQEGFRAIGQVEDRS